MEGQLFKKIAIIGCGIFGAQIAIKLSSQGHQVSIFEKNAECLTGATLNNQNRLHLGFHYPRDLNTGLQCIKGFDKFIEEFPECIEKDFDNAYFISTHDSLTSVEKYKEFCKSLKIFNEPIDINNYQIELNNVDYGILTKEAVYDCQILRQCVLDRLFNTKTIIKNNCYVNDIKKTLTNQLSIYSNNENLGDFDHVINCTYANINLLTEKLGYVPHTHQYEYTFTPIIKLNIPKIGITIMDGHFTTLLPYGKSDKFLLYHVKHSVIETKNATELDQDWLDISTSPIQKIDLDFQFSKMIEDCSKFMPWIKKAKYCGFLCGPRMVKAKSDETDERPSNVDFYKNNYCTIFSGKIDHSIWVADDVAKWINIKNSTNNL